MLGAKLEWDRVSMENFSAYFDVSGHPDAPGAMFSSGFVSSADKWLRFTDEWHALLYEYSIKNPFHMAQFAARKGQYESWGSDSIRRAEFYAKVTALIQKRTFKGFSQGLYVPDFHRMHREYEVPEDGMFGMMYRPITFCGLGSLIQVGEWAKRSLARGRAPTSQVHYFHDRGDKHRGHFAGAMRAMFGVDPQFEDKSQLVALQLADILAWEHATFIRDALVRLRPEPRAEARELFRRLPGGREWKFMRWPGLDAICRSNGWRPREPKPA